MPRPTARGLKSLTFLVAACALILSCTQAIADVRSHAPSWVDWTAEQLSADLDGDGLDEQLELARGTVRIAAGAWGGAGDPYRSPAQWAVSDAYCGDVDDTPGAELLLVVWKRGNYGHDRPFWETGLDAAVTQHVFVMSYHDGELWPVWMSSSLGRAARASSLDDQGRLHLVDAAGEETVWEWDHWGLKEADGDENGAPRAPGTTEPAGRSEAQPHDGGSAWKTASVVAVGDNIMHAGILAQMRTGRNKFDFSPLYAPVEHLVSAADLASVVQETPLVVDPSAYGGYPSFGTPTAVGDALAEAGFDVVCAATNHAADRQAGGIEDTVGFWNREHPEVALLGIHAPASSASPHVVQANGISVALVDYTFGLNDGVEIPEGSQCSVDMLDDTRTFERSVADARAQADFVLCYLHVGDEYATAPTPEQRSWAERAIDAGADVVVCSHPHVVQPLEHMTTSAGNSAPVYWSLGNFASHQTRLATILGGMATFELHESPDGERSVEACNLVPLVCHYDEETTAVYPLDAYTDDLARKHYLNQKGTAVSLEALEQTWRDATAGSGA